MSTEELRKAVEAVKWLAGIADERAASHLAVIRNALRDQEVEIDRLTAAWDSAYKQAMQNGESTQVQRDRAERAEALLREALPYCDTFPDLLRDGGDELSARITAHLGAEHG